MQQLFILCLVITGGSVITAHFVQNDFGNIDVKVVRIVDESGLAVVGKLYIPKAALDSPPVPGVLLLHGMNNDKDTEGPAALELARRGIVALAIDQLSHGDSDAISNPLSLLGGDSNTLGADAAYNYLQSLSFVDETRIGLVGHSMGAGTARAVAEMNPDHRAIAIQADGPYNFTEMDYLNNYLAVWSFYEELFTAQPREEFLQDSLEMIAQNENISILEAQSDYTYGSFANGSAHRYAKCPCTHPGATWNSKGIAETCAWMLQALLGESETEAWNKSGIHTQTYMIREGATLLAVIVSVLSLIPLASLLLETPYFDKVARPLPTKVAVVGKKWWIYAGINSLIGGVTFLFLPMVGLFLGAIVGSIVPIFLLVTGNGSLLWLLVNALIAFVVFRKWFRGEQEVQGLQYEDVGRFRSFRDNEARTPLLQTIVLACTLFAYMYGIVALSQSYLGIEFRYMWPVFKLFTPLKLVQFFLYVFPVMIFFLINGGVFLFGMLRQEVFDSPIKTQVVWWLKSVFAMESALLAAILIQYVPMFLFGTGPLLSFGGLFGLYGIFLMQILPFFGGMFFIMTAFYLKTGRVYLGTIIATLLTVWVFTAGMII
ncbi:MAG: alpha/beta fold hydrolase [Candidatus Thorarchaeota archaeon]|nr:alpha/beta fold hydrolase [Candidatus Thorarchaeota archaeon]